MSEGRNNMVAYTEDDKARVAAIAFTSNINDQRAYLTTIRGLHRILRGVAKLAVILDGSDPEYAALDAGVKICLLYTSPSPRD